jgi:hypothetical protein
MNCEASQAAISALCRCLPNRTLQLSTLHLSIFVVLFQVDSIDTDVGVPPILERGESQ